MTHSESQSIHRAVMVREVLDAIQPVSGGHYLDATLGGATHTMELLKHSSPDGIVLSLDVDPAAINRAQVKQSFYGKRWLIAESNFRHLKTVAQASGLAPFDGVLFDLGISSDQLEDPAKGISFQTDGPLDMRLGPMANDDGLTAQTIVNQWSEKELTRLIRLYGEDSRAYFIAKAIVARRRTQPFKRTQDLAEVIAQAVPRPEHGKHIHPATKTFQALRIAVNDELESLRIALADAFELLKDGGTLAVISFHSLEDRIVKQTFKKYKNAHVSKKPICPKADEIKYNPRARSAKLRCAKKIQIQKNKVCREPTLLP